MVAVVSGAGLGLFGSSLSALGGAGSAGTAGAGRGNDRMFVNTATGNLVVQSQDERLSALGLDLALIRTYNSQGLNDYDNGDNWRLGVNQRIVGLTGTVNTSGSTVTKVFGDGREVLYTYVDGTIGYRSTEGDGAHDTLKFASSQWTWTDGSSRATETYNSSGLLTSSQDADGNTITYSYTGNLLTHIEDASGQDTYLDYSGNNLTQIRVVSDSVTQTLTRYTYDGSDRLVEVRVDLTPQDNSVSDDVVYVTAYAYDGSSNRVERITQPDGTFVEFEYDSAHRISKFTDGDGRITTFDYATGTGASVEADEGALSTTREETTTVTPGLNSGPLSTTDVVPTEHTYDLDGDELTEVGTPPASDLMYPGIPVSITAAASTWTYYKIEVPSGMSALTVFTRGGPGSANLYVRHGEEPTQWPTEYDAYSTGGSVNQSVVVTEPDSGTWYIGVYAEDDISGLELYALPQTGTDEVQELTEGVAFTDISGDGYSSTENRRWFQFEIEEGTRDFRLDMSGPSTADNGPNGATTLYLMQGEMPDPDDWNPSEGYSDHGNGSNRSLTVREPAAGTWYALVDIDFLINDTKLVFNTNVLESQPEVDAGAAQTVRRGDSVSLTATASDVQGAVSYEWTQLDGPTVTLTNATSATAGFTAPTITTSTVLTFQVKVTDSAGLSNSDVVRVLVAAPVPSYTVQSGDTWASIAETLYGSSAVASLLQTALSNPALTASTVLTGLPDSLTASVPFGVAVQTPATELHSGIVVENVTAPTGSWAYYTIEVPVGTTTLSIATRGGVGDLSLLASHEEEPTWLDTDYSSVGLDGSIFVDSPAAGTWYIGLQSNTWPFDTTGVELVAEYSDAENEIQELTPGEAITGLSGNDDEAGVHVFSFDLAESGSSFRVDLNSIGADVDMFIKHGSPSEGDDTPYVGYGPTGTESVLVNNAAAGTWYVTIRGYGNYYDGKLLVTTDAVNDPPAVDAGGGQSVRSAAAVSLSATGSDAQSSVSYAWTQIGGTSVTLTGANTANAGFTAPTVTTSTMLSFQVTVTDAVGETARDTVNVWVSAPVQSYTVQSGDTWASIAETLYGTSSVASALQTALGNPTLTPSTVLTSLPATLSGNDIALQDDATELHNGVAVQDISIPQWEWRYYTVNVPADVTMLTVTPRNASGTAYLYAREGAQPTDSVYDSHNYSGEPLVIANPDAGVWHVGIRTDTVVTDLDLEVVYETDTDETQTLVPGETVVDVAADSATPRHFSFEIAEGTTSLQVNLNGINGHGDLYLKRGSEPEISDYDYASETWPNARLFLDHPEAGTWYLMIASVYPFSGAQLQLTTDGQNMPPQVRIDEPAATQPGLGVALDAVASDVEGSLTYAWTQVSGPSVTLSNGTTAHATFTAPTVTSDTVLTFKVLVTDARGATDTDVVQVLVKAPATTYVVQTGDTWASIAEFLYGTAAVASALQTALDNPALTPSTTLEDLPATLSASIEFNIAPLDEPDLLHNGVPATGLSGRYFQWHYYRIEVPEDATALTARAHGNGGSPTIYLRHGEEPTWYEYAGSGSPGHAAFVANPDAGVWYVGLFYDLDTPEVTLEALYQMDTDTELELVSGEAVSDIAGGTEVGEERVFSFEVPTGVSSFRLDLGLENESDEALVHLRHESAPEYNETTESYEADYTFYSGALQSLLLTDVASGTWYVMTRGVTTFSGASLVVNLEPANSPPTVSGVDRTASRGSTVNLTATGNDAESSVTYEWMQLSGPTVTLTNGATANASFTAPNVSTPTMLTFEVKATDARGASTTDLVRIFVTTSTLAYVVQSGDTWNSIALALYGSTSVASQLQAALGNPTLAVDVELIELPASLSVTTNDTVTVPPYYLIPSGATWRSIANTLYGVDSVAAGTALQTAMGNPALTAGNHLTSLPSTLTVTTTTTNTVDAYYTVQAGEDWEDITEAIYGTTDPDAVEALQTALGNPTLSTGLELEVPLTLTYGSGGGSGLSLETQVTIEATGLTTTYLNDSQGRLTSVLSPAVGGASLETRYTYDSDGNVTSIAEDPEGLNRVTTLAYDLNGNLLLTRDARGNTVTRTYDDDNQLLTQSSYVVRDPDGSGSSTASSPLTAHYIYDSENHLRFAISAQGRVTEHRYNSAGERTSTLQYVAAMHSGSTYTEGALETWVGLQDLSRLQRTNYAYDFRGNLESVTAFNTTNSSGVGTGTPSVTQFVYDQRGQLLQTLDARGSATTPDAEDADLPYATTYTYDGVGRVLSTTQWRASGSLVTTLNAYDDENHQTTTTLANGLVSTRTFDGAGNLISVVNGTAGALGTTTYVYDDNGRLRIQTDPNGNRQFSFYDDAGRKNGVVDSDGTLTEYIYDATSRLIKTVRYAELIDSVASLVDGSGNPTSVTLATLRTQANGTPAQNQIERNVYDVAGALTYVIDAAGAVTQFFHDGAGRVTDEVRYANTVSIAASTDEVLEEDLTITTSADDRRTRNFYDADGKLLGSLDAAGYLVEYVYDGAGYLIQQIGYATQTNASYWAAGTLEQLRPATDNESVLTPVRDINSYFFYDGQGRQIGVLDGEGYLTEKVYDAAGNLTDSTRYDERLTYVSGTSTFQSLKDVAVTADSQSTSYEYDGEGRLERETNHEGTITRYKYDTVGNLVEMTRALGTGDARTTQQRFDFLGRVVQELTAEGYAQITGGMNSAQINAIWDKYGITYAYDVVGRRISATQRPNDSQTNTTLYFYDADNRLRFEVNALGEVKESRYNALGQLTDSIAYQNRISTSSLTGGLVNSTLIARVDTAADEAADAHTTYAYTLTGQLASLETAENAGSSHGYNAFGERTSSLTQVASGTQRPHEYVYDKRGLLAETTWGNSGLNTTETREYDAFGRLTQLTDARGNASSIEYDRLGRQIATVDALDARRVTTYDAFSRLLTVSDALSPANVTTYSYDDAERSMTITTPEGVEVTTARNRHGEQVNVTAAGNTTTYSYSLNGQLTGTSDDLGALEERTYDRNGRQLTQDDARGATTVFTYDAANRVLTRTVDSGGLALLTSYEYDGQGRVTSVTDPNGTVTETEYDMDGRVVKVTVDAAGLDLQTVYAYDRAGNVVSVTEGYGSANPRVTEYTFDILGRRTQEVVDPGSGNLNLTTQFSYDANGNVTRKTDAKGNRTWYVYDASNRLIQTVDALGGVTELTYDAEGRVTQTRRYATSTSTSGFGASITARTVESEVTDRVQLSFYDTDGRERFTVDALGGITERTFDDNGNVIYERMYAQAITAGLDTIDSLEDVEEEITESADDRQRWSAYDLRGQMVFSVDTMGAVTRFERDLNGNLVSSTSFAALRTTSLAMDTDSLETWAEQTEIEEDAGNRTTRSWYDAVNREVYRLDAGGYLTQTAYDDTNHTRTVTLYANTATIPDGATLAQIAAETDGVSITPDAEADQSTQTDYDAAGRIAKVTDAVGEFETYEYDAVGNKVEFTNKKGDTWTYVYDANRRLIAEHSPEVEVTTVASSGTSSGYGGTLGYNLTSSTETESVETRIEYDALGNVTARIEAYGTAMQRTTSYEYDALGRQVRVNFPTVYLYERSKDDLWTRDWINVIRDRHHFLEESVTPYSRVTYDTLGNAIANRDVGGGMTRKFYDSLGRVIYAVDAERYITRYSYDAFGNQVELTRYAVALDLESEDYEESPLSLDSLEGLLEPNAGEDRTIVTEYDVVNRVTSVTQPETLVFEPSVGESGGALLMASPQTVTQYNAQGQAIKQSTLVSAAGAGQWADTYYYYDARGLRVAQVDALGYLTTYEYDGSGNLTSQTEYATALESGDWDAQGHEIPAASTGGELGADRIVEWEYDQLDRKTLERRKNMTYSVGVGSSIDTDTSDQVTEFFYDALGNQTRVMDAAGASTYMYYDALGRQIATAAPQRNLGDTTLLTPLTRMRRDALGNLVEQIVYAQGASEVDETGFTVTSSGDDRTARMLVDDMGNVIQTQDASGVNHFAAYNARGQLAREWQAADLFGYTYPAITFTIYSYDKLGRLRSTLEPRYVDGGGYGYASVGSYVLYNAFGEVINKNDQELFKYDQAGRMWRSNGDDGVYRIYLYNLAGQVTAEIRSQTLDLSTYTAASAAALTSQRMRTETRHDLLGRVVERRSPDFLLARPEGELQVIAAGFEIDDGVLGPNNPDSVYRVATREEDLGYGTITQQYMYIAPGGPSYEGGDNGYYIPAASGPSGPPNFGGFVQDPDYALVPGRYIHWAQPDQFGAVYGLRSTLISFEYRSSGSSGPWTELNVVALPGDEVGVKLDALANGDYDYRIRYTRLSELTPYALATGTMSIGSSSLSLVDTTEATLDADNITPTSVSEQVAINTQFRDAQFTVVYDTGGLTALDGFVYRRQYTPAGYVFVPDRQASLSGNGGYYLTASGYVRDTGYDPVTSRSIRWNVPATGGVTPHFQYRMSGSQVWQSLSVTTVGSQYFAGVGALADEHYDFRITYTSGSDPTPVATANGTFTLQAVSVSRDIDVTPDPADEAGTVALIGNRPPGALGISAQVADTADLDEVTEDGLLFTGNNDVIVKFPSISGPVRVELEYQTLAISPEDDPGPDNLGWPSESRHVSLQLSSASTASSGLHVVWRDPSAPEQAGGIQQVTRVRVYSIAADGSATLSYASDAADAKSMGGTSLSWHAPWDTSVTATFEIRRPGDVDWDTLTVSRTAGDFTVDVAALGSGEWEYKVTYEQDEVTRATTQGKFLLSAGGAINIPEDPGSGPFPIEPVSPVAALVAAPVEFSIYSSAEQEVTDGSYDLVGSEMENHRPLTMDWTGENRIDLTWANIGTGQVRVEVDYTSGPRYSYNFTNSTPPRWEETPVFVAGRQVTRTFNVSSGANTGATLTWSDDTGDVGGIQSINRVRVYTQVSSQWVLQYDRDAQAPHGGTTLYWSQPDDPEVDTTVRVRPIGSSTWQSLSLLSTVGGLQSVDLSALTSDDYEYQIEHSVTASSVTTLTALTYGTFTIDTGASSNARSTLLDVTQNNVTYDQGENDFGPVAWDGEELAWDFAPQPGDTIVLRTRVAGTSSWSSQSVTGSSGTTTVAATVAANQALEYEITYTASGGGAPYAQAVGTLNRQVATVGSPASIGLTQTSTYSTAMDAVEGLDSSFGSLSWSTEFESWGDTVTFEYQLPDDSWEELPVESGYDRFVADTSTLEAGTYRYRISYNSLYSSLPYAFASGEIEVGGAGSGGGAAILDNTRYWTTIEHQTGNVPTQHQTLDRWGNVLSLTDAAGYTTHYRYNERSQLLQTESPEVIVVDTTGGVEDTSTNNPITYNYYDLTGRLIATEDANGNVSSVTYNDAGQIIAEIRADGSDKTFLYNAFGNQVQVTDELGYRTRNEYDASDRLTSVQREVELEAFETGGAGSVLTDSYEYDTAGNRTKETNAAGEETQYTYDLQGNVLTRTTDLGSVFEYEYSDHNRRIGERNPNDTDQIWAYDYFGRLIAHTDMGGTTFLYQYNKAGALTLQTSTLGQNLQYSYDDAGHVSRILDRGIATSVANAVSTNSVVEYGYDIAGRRVVEISIVDGRLQQNSTISYDALGRMTRVSDTDFVVEYDYDAVGNRTHISSEYFDHDGYGTSNRRAQDLWYTYDSMNRVLVSQGVRTGHDIDISNTQGTELAYDLKGQRASATQGGRHMKLNMQILYDDVVTTSYERVMTGLFTERYEYDGLGRLMYTNQDVATTTYNFNTDLTTNETTAVRTNTKVYDAASREISDESYSLDGAAAGSLTHMLTLTTYTRDGLPYDQWTRKNGKTVAIIRYGTATYVEPTEMVIGNPGIQEYRRAYVSANPPDGVSGGSRTATLRQIDVEAQEGAGPTFTTVVVPGHWAGLGYDSAGVLRSYRVETYQESDGKYLYATDYNLSYRMADTAQLAVENARSYTTVHGVTLPGSGAALRTYDVNGALVAIVDQRDNNNNRHFANNALGQTLTVVQGLFDGQSGRMTLGQAFDNALLRTGNQVKAQYFFCANGQTVGSFGQLAEAGVFKANFDVNFTPISAAYPGQAPGQLVVQQDDTLRSIAARVFGDPNLWYVIAEENGLTNPDAELNAGTLLRIPNDVIALSNNASVFKPFDVTDAIGDTTPTQPLPKPRKKGCGVVGQILVIVVAIVVTYFTAGAAGAALSSAGTTGAAGATFTAGWATGLTATQAIAATAIGAAAGSAASQLVAIAIGQQDSFSWKSVATAALSAGIGKGISVTGIVGNNPSINAAVNSTVNQGVNMAVGLQKEFNWKAVAISAVAAPVASSLGSLVDDSVAGMLGNELAGNLAGGFVNSLVNQVAYASFTGGKVNFAQLAADSFGNALGNSIVDGMQPKSASRPSTSEELGMRTMGQEMDGWLSGNSEGAGQWNSIGSLSGGGAALADSGNGGYPIRGTDGSLLWESGVTTYPYIPAEEPTAGPLLAGPSDSLGYNRGGLWVPSVNNAASWTLTSGRETMREYWTTAQDNADTFFEYAGAGIMRFLGDAGYSAAEMGAAIYNDPQGALVGAGKAIVNFGPESFNALANLTKTSLNGWTMLAEATIAPQGTFAGFREGDPYNIELLATYASRAEAGGALLANVGLGVGLAKYGNVSLQSPLYLDLQQGAVAYSGLPIGVRSLRAPTGEARFLSQGFNADQAKYLAQPYEGMGHHFFRREWDLPEVITESPLSILKPSGISRGDFYELHYKVDPTFYGARFPSSIGGSWSGRSLGLQKYGTVGRLWYGSPAPLKVTVGASAAAGGGAAYWYFNGNE